MLFVILYLLQYFLKYFFIPLRRITFFVEKICKLAGEFAF